MTYPAFIPFNYRHLTGAFLLSALFLGGKAQAQVDFYVSETAQSTSNSATTILEFTFNPFTDTATQIGTFTPTGVLGGSSPEEGGLQFTGNGDSLSYSGFNSAGKSTEVLFTPSTDTFNSTSLTSNGTIRNSYYGTSTSGINGFFSATGSQALGFVAQTTGTTTASVVSNDTNATGAAGSSALDVSYNSGTQNLYYTRNSTVTSGVYTPSQSGSGLLASPVTYTQLSGSGWNTSQVTTGGVTTNADLYTGMAFLGTSSLFVADTTKDTLDLFTAANPDETNDWNLKFSLSLSTLTTEDIEQISVHPLSATTADIFFTTDGTSAGAMSPLGGTSTVDEVSYNSSTGFGTPTILESSSTESFTGVAAVPEPGTWAMFGLGLGLMVLMLARKKAGRKNLLG